MGFSRKRSPERVKHRQGLIRVFGYATAVGLVCAAFSIRAARAEITDQSLIVGRQMIELSKSSKNDIAKVILNGQTMFFANSYSDDDSSKVLERFAEHCEKNAAQSPETWRELAEKTAKLDAAASGSGQAIASTGGMLRGGTNEEGTILCFVRSESSKPTFSEAMASFQQTGELSALGMLRYVYVKKSQKGGSHILAAWTLEKFNVKEMMPDEDQDVPGEDFSELPRPDGSVRTFAARLDGAPFGVNIYESTSAPEKVALSYDAMLTKQGWFAIDIESEPKRSDPSLKGVTGRVYQKDGVLLTMVSRVERNKTITGLGVAGVPERETRRD
jgi:hypothetical protein